MKSKMLLLVLLCSLCFKLHATIINVPASAVSIQDAINLSVSGDTILVSPGTYYENINFNGKNVIITSMFYLGLDTGYISSTIINGNNPANPDTGSCVIFNNGEDSTAVLQGFTITGGTGTKWTDIHGAGIYREGGGILIELSSPTIRFNKITGNTAVDLNGVQSAGGGGIRAGDGNPCIHNNVISLNQARYGAGIVLNYTGCTIRNNLIVSNSGGQDYYGGAGIWMVGSLSGFEKVIENNTLANNYSSLPNGTGGISCWSAGPVIIKNNIVYGNSPALQIKTISSSPQVSYSNIQGGFAGNGNIDTDPMFGPMAYLLQASSPCIDAGDDDITYNDGEDPNNPGFAMWPSMGMVRNDMGTYGGLNARVHPAMTSSVGITEIQNSDINTYPNPFTERATLSFPVDLKNASLILVDESGKQILLKREFSGNHVEIERGNLSSGIYVVRIAENNQQLVTGKVIIAD